MPVSMILEIAETTLSKLIICQSEMFDLALKRKLKLLTSCLTAVKNHVIRYCEKVYERSGKICFGLLKILVRYLIN